MLRRLLFAILLFGAATTARALEYTDVYFNTDEPGWGLFLVQSDTFQFVAFFIYGPDGKPVWYTAELTNDGTGTYSGPLYVTTGSYFADPWDPSKVVSTQVGTASFSPADLYRATLTYALTGGPTVTKSVQRQTLTGYPLAGNYSGSLAGTVTGCNDPSKNNNAFRGRYSLAVTQVGDTSATLTFTFVDTNNAGLVCTLAGTLTHLGRLYQVAGAQYSCTGTGAAPGTYAANIEVFHPTGQGIEGRWSAPVNDGCVHGFRFAAVHL